MNQSVQPATIAAASLVIQVCLLFIAYVALWLLSKSYSARVQAKASYGTLVMWFLVTMILLVMGEDLYATWGLILRPVTLPTVPRDYAFLSVFVLDIVFVTLIILRTGGTKKSPLTSVLFLLPSLAIFLREPVWRFVLYSVVVGTLYATLLRKSTREASAEYDRSEYDAPSRSDEAIDDRATRWTNLSCLMLATLIGYITQPTT